MAALNTTKAAALIDEYRRAHRSGNMTDTRRKAAQIEASAGDLARQINALYEQASAAGRDSFLASEQRDLLQMEASAKLLEDEIAAYSRVDRPGVIVGGGNLQPADTYIEGKPLTRGQTFSAYTRSRASVRGEDFDDGPLDLDKYLRGALTGNWRGAEREQRIMAAMSGASSAAGGVLIPTILTGQLIDLARAQTRVLEAGATIVPMESRTVDVPRWTQDPTLSWRTENAIVAESDGAMDKVTLSAKSLATVVRVARELVEDTDISGVLANAFAAALAVKIDQAGLYGDGTGGAPTGVKATAGVTKTSMGANGATMTSWDNLVDSVGRLRDNNENPNATIMADRSARVLAKLKASGSGEYLAPPTYLDDVPRLTTSAVPTNLTVGSSTDTSDVFTADWSQLLVGVRTDLQVTVLSERYMTNDAAGSPAGGQYGFMAWWRGDIVVARPKAFDVITGVRG